MSEPMTAAPPLLANGRPVPAERMTYEQFLEWLDDETHAEWVDGRVVPMSPITMRIMRDVRVMRVARRWQHRHRVKLLTDQERRRLPTRGIGNTETE